jgi:CRP-like cAMP-binding protein
MCVVVASAGLAEQTLLNAARSMTEVYFKCGDNIIVQDDIGDSFFILEEGKVVVTVRSLNMFACLWLSLC